MSTITTFKDDGEIPGLLRKRIAFRLCDHSGEELAFAFVEQHSDDPGEWTAYRWDVDSFRPVLLSARRSKEDALAVAHSYVAALLHPQGQPA